MNFKRHTLCYLKPEAEPLNGTSALLTDWLRQQFPLIYTHQPASLTEQQIKLAIPYYMADTQEKIRESFLFAPEAISHCSTLPHLKELFPNLDLEFNSVIYVYGSYCWQHITQHPYIHPSSDLDLQLLYTAESLDELILLHHILRDKLPIHSLDGEVRFPHFGDCSWQELIHKPFSSTILFKSERHIRLVPREELYAIVPTLLA